MAPSRARLAAGGTPPPRGPSGRAAWRGAGPRPLLPALVPLLLPLRAAAQCPDVLPDSGPMNLYVNCPETISRRAFAETEPMGSFRSVWSDKFSSLLLVHDVPLLISRLPEAITGKGAGEHWNRWLVSMEPEWRDSNGGTMQVSYAGSKNSYNVIREGMKAKDKHVSKFAKKLLVFLQSRFLALMKAFGKVPAQTQSPRAGKLYTEGLGGDMCANSRDTNGTCTLKNLVSLYAWCNMFHQTGPYKSEEFIGRFHGHQHPWHGYLILNGSGTHTSFFSPFAKKFFTLKHENNHVVMLPGGFKHAAMHATDLADPRITVAFDIRMGDEEMEVHGIDFFGHLARLPPEATAAPLRSWRSSSLDALLAELAPATGASWGGVLPYARHVGGAPRKPAARAEL